MGSKGHCKSTRVQRLYVDSRPAGRGVHSLLGQDTRKDVLKNRW